MFGGGVQNKFGTQNSFAMRQWRQKLAITLLSDFNYILQYYKLLNFNYYIKYNIMETTGATNHKACC